MTSKPTRKSKLTDAERHKRFLDMAREVEASDDPKDFDKAFNRVTRVASCGTSSGQGGREKILSRRNRDDEGSE